MENNGQQVKPTVLLAMPQYTNSVKSEAAIGWLVTASQQHKCRVVHKNFRSSLLGRSFNDLWASALQGAQNGVITHFAMIHHDIGPEPAAPDGRRIWWLDEMLDEMERVRADVLSVVSPIKDHRGLTSTAIDDPQDPYEPERRLTMHEILQLPETFTAEDCFKMGINPHRHILLVNTGLLLVDIRKPWVLGDWAANRPVMFTINDRIRRNPDGQWTVDVESEDWYFSREAARWGAQVYCTRKIAIKHFGEVAWTNHEDWGTWKVDEDKVKEPEPLDKPAAEPEKQEV